MRVLRRTFHVLLAIMLPLVVGGARLHDFMARKPGPNAPAGALVERQRPAYDPEKPTVVVVLATDVSEITDLLGPYEMFARARAFNVYAVAPSRRSTALTGGLRLVPHYSFEEVDRLLGGKVPAIVVAPNLPNIRSSENRPVVEWVQRNARNGAISFSWCAGAAVLAEAGLLDGRTATSHWGDLARLEREYPRVQWVRGTRWIDHGSIVMSAGITSGIDATLHLLGRLLGDATARRVADELAYPNYHFALDPSVEQYEPRPADAVLFLNAAFKLPRVRIGLALYDGVGELDVSAIYDAHAAAGIANVQAIADEPRPVLTAHGLLLQPALVLGRDTDAIAALDRLVVPGRDAQGPGANANADSMALEAGLRPEYLQVEDVQRFSLEAVIEDLARTADEATATFALRRLEYRSSSVRLEGRNLPTDAILVALVLGIAGGLLAAAVPNGRKRFARNGLTARVTPPLDGEVRSSFPLRQSVVLNSFERNP
jgi:AraC family transcriptional regulator, transcriptional activator FtrA